jgi:hypothetical protein
MLEGKAPADLDSRHELRVESRNRQADKANERSGLNQLDSKGTKAVTVEVLPSASEECVGDFRGERFRKELHDTRVGVDLLEGQTVRLAPGAQEKALGSELVAHGRVLPLLHPRPGLLQRLL